jgi:soluble lytic murein transglycosylase-like protein
MDYTASIVSAANNVGVDPNLALAVAKTESSMNPNAVSREGAVGLFQLMPSSFPGENINDVQTNIELGVGYLAKLLGMYNGDTTLALAAYNAGPGTVEKYGGVPPYVETQSYISSVMGNVVNPQTLLSREIHHLPGVVEAWMFSMW